MSEELVIWMSPRVGFIDIADRFCTGSSIMPQKKNPDVPELARGKTGRVYGHLTGLLTLMKGQPLAYNKDNQEDKEPLFDTVDTVIDTLRIFADMAGGITVKPDAMRAAALQGYATATDLADYLVKKGLPFRDAHEAVARAVRACDDARCDLSEMSLERAARILAADRRGRVRGADAGRLGGRARPRGRHRAAPGARGDRPRAQAAGQVTSAQRGAKNTITETRHVHVPFAPHRHLNEKIAGAVSWALLAAVIICAGNALVRYIFNMSSNSLARDPVVPVRRHVHAGQRPHPQARRTRAHRRHRRALLQAHPGLDRPGRLPAVPAAGLPADPVRTASRSRSYSIASAEMSSNAGGLIVWPVKLLVPLGFVLLVLQGISEIIKRIAFLAGRIDGHEFAKHVTTPEEEIEAIKAANKL